MSFTDNLKKSLGFEEDDFGSADRGSNLGLLNLSDSTVNTEGGDLRCRAGFGERSQH